MSGSTANGLLTYHSTETASVESNITYDGSTQKLVNNGQINLYSGSYASGQEPIMSTTSALKVTSLLSPAAALYTPTGSKNAVLSVSGRHSGFGSDSNCSATLAIISQVGNSNKNATVQLTALGKQNGCHDAIFTIGVKQDAGSTNHPIHEMLRMDGRDRDITFSGSLFAQPSFISTSASLDNILVHDSVTGEIKTSTITPPLNNAVTSVNGATGAVSLADITNGSGIISGSSQITFPVTSVNGNTGAVTTTDKCVGTVCGEDASGAAASEVNVDTIEFQCASISTATNEATVKIHSATNTSNKAQIPFPDANDQLIGCNNIYVCTSHENNAALFNCGGGLGAFNNNEGSAQKFSVIREAFKGSNFMLSTANTAAPIYNIKDSTIGGYTKQLQTSSINILGNQTTGDNKFTRVQLVHCNTAADQAAAVHLDTIGANASSDRTDFAINLRGEDSLFYRRMHIESDSTTSANSNIIFSGSLHVDTSQMSTSASLASVLVYDNVTGEIKKSTLSPSTSTAEAGGASGNVQYNSGTSCGFAAESSFTYNPDTDKLTISNPGTGVGGLITNNIEGAGGTLVITDGGNNRAIQFCTFGNESLALDDEIVNIYGTVNTPNLSTTTATDCPSVVISATGELLEGPVGGAGTTPTLQSVTDSGNSTSCPIIFNNDLTNCIKTANSNQSGAGVSFILEGSDNNNNGGLGGNISICAGDAQATNGGNGGHILLKAGDTANTSYDKGYVCVEGKGLVVPDGISSEPGIAFEGDGNNSLGLWRNGDCVVISRDSLTTTTNHQFGPTGYRICAGSLAVGNISPSATDGRIDASNDIVAYSTSDCRLKKYVKPIKNALDKIDKIRGVEFDWKVTDEKMEKEVHSFEGHDVGVIAQEIEAVLPEVVTTRDSGYKAVRYDKIVPLLIQGIKELKDEVEILKTKI